MEMIDEPIRDPELEAILSPGERRKEIACDILFAVSMALLGLMIYFYILK